MNAQLQATDIVQALGQDYLLIRLVDLNRELVALRARVAELEAAEVH